MFQRLNKSKFASLMNRKAKNMSTPFWRNFFAITCILLICLTSCAVKGSIKSMVGIPVKAEQNTAKSSHTFLDNGSVQCQTLQNADIEIIKSLSANELQILPFVLFSAISLFMLVLATNNKAQAHPSYNNVKIPGNLPIFLQYRKLII